MEDRIQKHTQRSSHRKKFMDHQFYMFMWILFQILLQECAHSLAKGKIGIWKHISKRALILWPYFLLAWISCFICIIYTNIFSDGSGYNISLRNGSWSKDDLYSRFLLYSWVKHMCGVLRQIYIQEICFLSHSYDTGEGMVWNG